MHCCASSLFAALLIVFAGPALAQEAPGASSDDPFLRYPSISPDGQQLAFSYQGDLWTVPVDGGRAYRLTVHEAYEYMPRWRADGQQLAFVSDRFGNDDLFVMPAGGGSPQRLTYHSADDVVGSWTPDGHLLFETERLGVQVEWMPEIQQVAATGGTPTRVMTGLGSAPAMSPDGRFVVFERGASKRERKGYRGPTNRDLWIYDTENEAYAPLTDFEGSDFYPAWSDSRTVFFISERSGTYNVHRLTLGDDGQPTGAPEAVTDFDGDAVRFFSVSADGQTLAFSRGTHVYVMRDGGAPEQVQVEVPGDYRFDPVEREAFTRNASEYAVSPGGELVAFVVRGELFLMANDPEADRTVRLTRHAYRDRDVAWVDDETLLFTSDREGQYDVYRLTSADPDEASLFRTLRFEAERLTETPEDERGLVVAPDSQHVAFRRGRGQLVVALLDDGALGEETVLLDGWATPSDLAWSPDSRYLAYALDDLDFNEEIYIHPVDQSREPVNVTQHPRGDGSPVWSPDGRKLGFVSDRSDDTDVWFAWLREEDWQKTRQDWDYEEVTSDGEEDDSDTTGTPRVEIDFDGLYERLTQVTSMPGNEADPVIGPDGETFYFVAGRGGRTTDYDTDQDLYKIQWDGSERERVTEGDTNPYAVRLGPTGKRLFLMRSGGRVARVTLQNDKLEGLGFQARMEVDHAAERRQIFAEVWRTLEQGFYDPGYHGADWRAAREKYLPWALRASTDRDFISVMNWMLGELNASHMGYYASDRAETQDEDTGLLGAEIEPVEDGVRVKRVVPESPAARRQSRLYVGDVITAVDGTPVTEVPNYYALLTETAGERVLLTVDGEDGERSVVIRPASNLGDELYREWVAERRRLTDEYSNGRLGYIHIEGMNWSSFERFEREITASGEGKEGLVVDVRYNGGGWTTDYLMAVLTVRRHAYTVPRGASPDLSRHQEFRDHYPFGERLPYAAWTQHVTALCNRYSYSNAEIFSHAFKTLGLGRLVGTPTFGAVISTGGNGMINGSFVRLPFRGWYVYATNQNMELGPAVPDLVVENVPDAKARGEDAPLRRAVHALLEDVDGGVPARPGLSETAQGDE